MTFLSEFSYPDVSQRKIILINSIISFIILGYIYINAAILLNYYYVYSPIMQIVLFCAITGIFAGNLIGKLLFSGFKNNRLIYIPADIIFIILSSIYLYSRIIIPENQYQLIYLFFKSPYYIILLLFTISLFAGIKINYFLKLSCGNFIDNKRAAEVFLLYMLVGTAAGIALAVIFYFYKEAYYYSGVLPLSILPTVFLIKLSYNPKPIYAQEIKTNIEFPVPEKIYTRDDLFFIYLNFTIILIYIFLGFTCMMKFFGDFLHVKMIFVFISLLSLSAGFIFARIAKQAFWYIYAEMLYPVFFILTLLSLIYLKNEINLFQAACVFIPMSLILGFSLFQTINHILSNNNHKDRFNVINFSIFILPAPILISLNFIDFTYFWYFTLLYTVAILNIFIPGVYLMQSKIKEYKKALFFLFTLIFIPLLILMHMYFNIPMNRNLFISHTTGFDSLNYINYNSEYINNEATVYINGIKAFHADDPAIKNLKRSIAPAFLYADSKNWNNVLFIDGNHKFFKNPILSIFKNADHVDYLPDRITDYKALSISGDQNYILENSEILSYLEQRKSPYKIIVDIPNLFDQSINLFRFSKEYYKMITDHLFADGIFTQILTANSRSDFIVNAISGIKTCFKRTIIFYFPNYFVLMSSNNNNALNISLNNINNIKENYALKPELKNLFYNEFHLLSYILFLKPEDLIAYMAKEEIHPFYFLNKQKIFHPDTSLISGYTENNSNFIDLIDKNNPNSNFLYAMKNQVFANNFFLTEIKKAEIFEMNKEYENEAALLVSLRRQAEYMPELRKYISGILTYKEDYYYNAALRFERDKIWEDARKLYKSILILNKNNFEANYHLGILSIILQDLDESFEYLQYAMVLKKDNPKVFYHLGVLLFSRGKSREALVYLEKALEFKENSASLFYYIGLCHEELGNLASAINYYNQAITLDPNDKNISSSIERIKEKTNIKRNGYNKNEQSSDSEAEQGEDMPLPISESAINVRIEADKSQPSSPKK